MTGLLFEITPVTPSTEVDIWTGALRPITKIFSDEQLIEAAFTEFRSKGYPYRHLSIAQCMDEINKLALTDDAGLAGTILGHNVADVYHPHRFESAAAGMKSPATSFADDKLLRRAVGLMLKAEQPMTTSALHSVIQMVSGTQACANFRPGVALSVYREFGRTGARILDTSSGYGGRLVGFMASGLGGRYVGIDPSSAACTSNLRMARDLGFGDKVVQINAPAEDVRAEQIIDAADGMIDLCFTSPPYFTKERYATGHADETSQSWSRYPSADGWREGFLQPMLRLQYDAIRPGGVSVLNVQDVRLRDKVFPLTEWSIDAAQRAGFVLLHTMSLRMTHHFGAGSVGSYRSQNGVTASEPMFVFVKPAPADELDELF